MTHALKMTALLLLCATMLPVWSEADGPDFWQVKPGAPTPMFAQPATNALVLARIPSGSSKLANQGCVGMLNGDLWGQMSPAQQQVAEANVWCKIEFQHKTGWVQMMRLNGAN